MKRVQIWAEKHLEKVQMVTIKKIQKQNTCIKIYNKYNKFTQTLIFLSFQTLTEVQCLTGEQEI